MPRAPIAETIDAAELPSEKIVREANAPYKVTDADGRVITIKPLGILDHARLFRAVGSDNSGNENYMRLVQYAASIVDIDGAPGPGKNSFLQLEHRIEWMGDKGFMAIVQDEIDKAEEAKKSRAEIGTTDPEMKFKRDVKNS